MSKINVNVKEPIKYLELEKNKPVKVTWEVEGDVNEIEHTQTDCGCSSAFIEGNTVEVIYNHGSGNTTRKNIYLYLRDGKDLYIEKDGNKFLNPLKEQIILSISGLSK